jgi:clan AA aspartic protease (TIGR02281 family)
VRPAFQRAEALAADLGIRLPALPSYDPQNARKTSADAVVYLLRDAGMQLSAHLREQHSVVHAALFEFSSKATLLDWLYTPSDATCETLTRALLNNASQEANLSHRLWWPIFEGVVVKKLPAAQLKPLIKQALQEIERGLSEKSKGSITVGDKRSLTLPFLKQVPGGLVLSVTFNGSVSAPMLYDTGATTTIIDLATSRRLGISLEKALPFIVNTANGQVRMDMVEIDSVEVSGVKVEGPFELIVSSVHRDTEYVGLLGLNFSRAFVTTVDYDRNTITFRVR